MRLLDALVAAGIDPARMMPGTGCCSISETVELTAHAVKHGCAGVLMLPPFYYKNVSEEGLYRYFSEVVQRVSDKRLRIYLYHIPPVAVVGITPKLVERLLQACPTAIAGMKDSSGDWNNTRMFLDSFVLTARSGPTARAARTFDVFVGSESVRAGLADSFDGPPSSDVDTDGGFDVFVGSESFLLANMRHGGAGTISATANVNPAAIHSLFANARDEAGPPTHEASARLDLEGQQAKLNVVREVFARKSWPSMIAALKQAIAIYRNDPEWARVRPPLVELTTEQARTLAAELEKIEFRIKLVES
jgi:4-hydroxy-tetrahydrodipicolinate synthase